MSEQRRAVILAELAGLIAGDELRPRGGSYQPDGPSAARRGALLGELNRLRAETARSTEPELAARNAALSAELALRTGRLLAAWQAHRERLLAELTELRGARRGVGGYLSPPGR